MERTRRFFADRAERAANETDRSAQEQLADMAESIQETVRLLEHLRVQVDEVRHAIGLHLETTGPVPHTHRGRPVRGAR
ncbi:MAG TPA: hypothetical protein VF363_03215 [Candidatus Eisenbacteria bacterium]